MTTTATLLVALLLAATNDAGADPVLLDFHAQWCPPCRSMRPAVDQLVRAGYPVRSVDIDASPELRDRYRIEGVPTYIVADAAGKVLARRSGAMPARDLAEFYNRAKAKLDPIEPTAAHARDDDPAPEAVPAAPRSAASKNPLPWETVVRIKMHLNSKEWGFGSGTIIYSDQDKSIILTCAHIFRLKGQKQPLPKDFRVPITVDLFDGRLTGPKSSMVGVAESNIVGEAIDYDLDNDVGLIVIRPGRVLPATPVVPTSWTPKAGERMYAVGCSHGNDATAWNTTILDPKIRMSNSTTRRQFTEMKCSTEPMQGRSGGGLYTADGFVGGVCNFADPNEHVGLYAVPQAIHQLLDRNRMTALYRPASDDGTMLADSGQRPRTTPEHRVRAQSPDPRDESRPAGGLNYEDVTIPTPALSGVPPLGPIAVAPSLASARRPDGRPRSNRHDPSIDPHAPVATDLAATPDADADADTGSAPVPRPGDLSIPADPSRLGKWKPVHRSN